MATAGPEHGVGLRLSSNQSQTVQYCPILQTDRTGRVTSVAGGVVSPHPSDHLGLEDGHVTEDADASTISRRQRARDVQTSQWLSEFANRSSTSTSPNSEASSTVSATSLAGELEPRHGEVPVHVQVIVLYSQRAMVPTDPVSADHVVAMPGAPMVELGGRLDGVGPE